MNHSRLLFCTLRSIERISLGKSKASFTALRILIHQHISRFSPRVHCYPRLLVYPLQPMNTLKNHGIYIEGEHTDELNSLLFTFLGNLLKMIHLFIQDPFELRL